MRIAIDVSQAIYQTGVSTYTKNLIEKLLEVDTQNEYFLFGGSLRRKNELLEILNSFKGNVHSKAFSLPPSLSDFLANRIHFPKIDRFISNPNIYHSSDWAQFASNAKKVTTVHDLAPIFLSRYTDERIVNVHKRRLAWVSREVDRIIVPSEATKEDLERLGVNKDRIRVIYEAVGSTFTPKTSDEIATVKKKYKIFGTYLLAIGVNFRKNTQRIIEAYSKARNKDLKLVIVGYPYSNTELSRGVIYTGHVLETDLPSLYSGAEALVYPSLYEGFGLPILEAFSCNCPVITSNISSMPEVSGDAAVLVDPLNTDSIAEGIKKALRGKTGFVKKGLKQAKKFTWEKAAKQTLEVYKELI